MKTHTTKYPLRYQRFGRAKLRVSEIGMGCATLGGGLYGDDDQEALWTLQWALEQGVNFFDTAGVYSLGNSEKIIGKAFKGKRDQVIIATKVGPKFTPMWHVMARLKPLLKSFRGALRPFRRPSNFVRLSQKRFDYSAGYLRQEVDASLVRLQTDYIDLFQLDRPPTTVLQNGDFYATLDALKEEGKIRYYGICCKTLNDALICIDDPRISSVQIPVSLIDQEAIEKVIPLASDKGVAVITRAPLAQGLLTDGQNETLAEQSALMTRDEIKDRKQRATAFHCLATKGRTLAQAAIQFVLQILGISTVIPGMVNRQQLEENLGSLLVPPLTNEDLAKIQSVDNESPG